MKFMIFVTRARGIPVSIGLKLTAIGRGGHLKNIGLYLITQLLKLVSSPISMQWHGLMFLLVFNLLGVVRHLKWAGQLATVKRQFCFLMMVSLS